MESLRGTDREETRVSRTQQVWRGEKGGMSLTHADNSATVVEDDTVTL